MELDLLEMWVELMQLYESKLMEVSSESYINTLESFVDYIKEERLFERFLKCSISHNQDLII
jgi:hypothetical protein